MTSRTPEVDFSKIRTFEGGKQEAFEEFCCQLASRVAGQPEGSSYTRFRGAGGDGGVECVWRLPNDEEWGWQAKYIFKLNKSQVDKSFKTALDLHPKLTRYVVCLPFDLTGPKRGAGGRTVRSEFDRFEEYKKEWEELARGKGMRVRVELWSRSRLHDFLLEIDPTNGRTRYWFDETILGDSWFRNTVERAVEDVGPRYTPELNVELPIASVFEGICRTDSFLGQLRAQLGRIRKRRREPLLRSFGSDGGDFEAAADELDGRLDEIDARVMAIDVTDERGVDFEGLARDCSATNTKLYDLGRALDKRSQDMKGKPHKRPNGEGRIHETLTSAAYELRRIASEILELQDLAESDAARLVNLPALLLSGRPGTGKTHLLCDFAKTRVEEGRPTVLLLGNRLDQRPIWVQILEQLDLDCSAEQFLEALDAAANAKDTRAIIVIDAINEGDGLSLWKRYLRSFLSDIRKHARVGLVISCRTSYIPAVLPDGLDDDKIVRAEHFGFGGHEYQAIRTFFQYYELILPDFPLLVPEFSTPLFLKLVCEALRRQQLHTLPRGSTGVTQLFTWFLDGTEGRLALPERVNYRREDRLVARAVRALASEMLDQETEWLPMARAKDIAESILPGREWSRSLLQGLISEGVLSSELMGRKEEDEYVSFSYQRLGDHLRALEICERNPSEERVASYCEDLVVDERTAYRNSGLLEALAVHIPETLEVELHELLAERICGPVRDAYLESLIWRDPNTFPAEVSYDFFNEVATSSRGGQVRALDTLLQLACVPGHPFNAEVLHRSLWRQTMPDRDAWWTTFLHEDYREGSASWRIIDWAWSDETDYCADDAALLCATALGWYLTSSNRFIRDRATKALVSLLRNRPQALLDWVERFHEVNDPYVAERVYAVAYGCSMRANNKGAIARIAKLVYENVFDKAPPPVHVLLRDYARGIIERAHYLGCSLEGVDLVRVRPPYESPWPITARSEEQLRETYYDDEGWWAVWGSVMSPMGDFNSYVIEPAVSRFLAPNQRKRITEARKKSQERAAETEATFRKGLSSEQASVLEVPFDISEVEAVLSTEQLLLFGSVLSHEDPRFVRDLPITFELQLAARWIFSRVVSLGWTPEQFKKFDTAHLTTSRDEHKAERLGKKYQWIAFHELLARIADHCVFLSELSSLSDAAYDGPWELWVRDIDPSLGVKSTGTQRWFETSEVTWWATTSPDLPQEPSADDLENWLQRDNDLPDLKRLLEVQDEAGDWVVLESYNTWTVDTPPEDDPYEVDRPEVWYQVRSYTLKTADFAKLRRWAKATNWMGRWMPNSLDSYKMFLGEYTWHPSSAECTPEWTHPESFRKGLPAPILVTTARYHWEGGGRDCSMPETVAGIHPSTEILTGLGASWHGRPFRFEDDDDRILALDPSGSERGPAALLVRREEFFDYLGSSKQSMIWTILGEKRAFSRNGPRIGRLEIYGCYTAHEGTVALLSMGSRFVPWGTPS